MNFLYYDENFTKTQGTLDESWESLIILKEVKNAIGKFLQVWPSSTWRLKFVEKDVKFT